MAVNESEVIVIYVKNYGAFYVKYSRFMCVRNNLHAFFAAACIPWDTNQSILLLVFVIIIFLSTF